MARRLHAAAVLVLLALLADPPHAGAAVAVASSQDADQIAAALVPGGSLR